jgi:hypothetical protein
MSEIERSLRSEDGPSIDHRVFLPSLIIVLIAGVYLVIAPGRAESEASVLMSLVTTNFGWLFLLVAMATLGFCGWLAFGRYGSVRLGDPGEQPEFRELSWAAMMFTAGIGIGLVSWAFVEPVYYLTTPPMGLRPERRPRWNGAMHTLSSTGAWFRGRFTRCQPFQLRIPYMSENRLSYELARRLRGHYRRLSDGSGGHRLSIRWSLLASLVVRVHRLVWGCHWSPNFLAN